MRSRRCRRSLQPVLLFFAVLPFWSNYLIRTYAWIVLLNREGLVTQLLRWFGYDGEPPSMLYTEGAVIAGLVYNYLPFVILACYAPLSRLNPELAEASRDLGGSAFTTFRRITLPLTLPGIAAGAVFVFVLSIGNFVTPALLGGGRFQMIGNLVYDQFLTANDWPFGAALSMVLIAIMMLLLLVQAICRRTGRRRVRSAPGRTRRWPNDPPPHGDPAQLVLVAGLRFPLRADRRAGGAVLQRGRAADGLVRLLDRNGTCRSPPTGEILSAALNTLIVAAGLHRHRHAARHAAGASASRCGAVAGRRSRR